MPSLTRESPGRSSWTLENRFRSLVPKTSHLLSITPVIRITEARVSFFFNGESGAGPGFSSDKPSEVEIFSIGQDVQSGEATTLTIGGSFETLSEPIPLNPTESDSSTMTDIDLSFDENVGSEDFYVLTLRLSNGETYTYFVSHP